MSNSLSRLRKKRAYPVTIDGEGYHVRSLTIGELRRLDALDADSKTGFVVGCALCDENGAAELPRIEGETDSVYSARVLVELDDVPTENIRALSEAVGNIGKTPTIEAIAKN